MTAMNADVIRTRRCVEHYRKLGLCPLPSKTDVKGPMLETYADHYGDVPVPEWVYRDWPTPNVQLICGTKSPTPTKIIVVDIDSLEARQKWHRIAEINGYVPGETWTTRTGGGGWQYWFTLPEGVAECPSGMIYGVWDTFGDDGKGRWLKHVEIRILGDRSLAIAPPSIHVETGDRYCFSEVNNPNLYSLPEPAPEWLLKMPRLAAPSFETVIERRPFVQLSQYKSRGRQYNRDEVMEAVGSNKLSEAKDWGLVTRRDMPNANGWVQCYVPDRENPRHSTPSGSFSFDNGTFQDRKDLSTVSFFDLGVLLGAFSTWFECCNYLGEKYIGTSSKTEPTRSFAYSG